ncbi:very-long-chain (3r)-3-hydroxyacyl-coa dehydratase pasticcino 2 [Phtheirospermum japonicum]|uniref:Very-long-chain (3R)-3-hydroxyacyl-CoA dehydratase n=1 Tax=Phtheirospermum japonicum TaxID=374723 RepID=A0A830CSQ3_9LAMI|nr:very-long-chain (3r)-3-hydroxyacyl-coa dehydratase pasticcino 2 [Phtheirospermum japonicum]
MASLRRSYLISYNWVLFFGWSQVFYLFVKVLRISGHESVYAAVEKPLILAQSAALLEILQGLTRIVRSPVTPMLQQVSSRLYVKGGILNSFPEIRTHFFVGSLVINWSVTEIIRYSLYINNAF